MNMKNIQTSLYNGSVGMLFKPFGHKYIIETVDGKRVDQEAISVTTVLKNVIAKPVLINWAARMAVECVSEQIEPGKAYDEVELMSIFDKASKAHYQKKVDAGNLGTFVHNWVENYINGEHPVIPQNENLRRSVEKFLSWEKEHSVKFLLSEQQVYSKKYNYTGTIDFICMIDGEMYIGDLKTSSGIYSEYLIQTAAYRYARSEEYPEENYVGQIIVRVGKDDGVLEIAVIKNDEWYRKMFTTFIAALKLKEGLSIIDKYKTDSK